MVGAISIASSFWPIRRRHARPRPVSPFSLWLEEALTGWILPVAGLVAAGRRLRPLRRSACCRTGRPRPPLALLVAVAAGAPHGEAGPLAGSADPTGRWLALGAAAAVALVGRRRSGAGGAPGPAAGPGRGDGGRRRAAAAGRRLGPARVRRAGPRAAPAGRHAEVDFRLAGRRRRPRRRWSGPSPTPASGAAAGRRWPTTTTRSGCAARWPPAPPRSRSTGSTGRWPARSTSPSTATAISPLAPLGDRRWRCWPRRRSGTRGCGGSNVAALAGMALAYGLLVARQRHPGHRGRHLARRHPARGLGGALAGGLLALLARLGPWTLGAADAAEGSGGKARRDRPARQRLRQGGGAPRRLPRGGGRRAAAARRPGRSTTCWPRLGGRHGLAAGRSGPSGSTRRGSCPGRAAWWRWRSPTATPSGRRPRPGPGRGGALRPRPRLPRGHEEEAEGAGGRARRRVSRGCAASPPSDVAPTMEKVWAQRAGLGWIGKNGCLITPRHGSWVLLATLLLDRDARARRAAPGALRHLPGLPAGLPHRRHPGAGLRRRPPLPLLLDHRAARGHPDGHGGAAGRLGSSAATTARPAAPGTGDGRGPTPTPSSCRARGSRPPHRGAAPAHRGRVRAALPRHLAGAGPLRRPGRATPRWWPAASGDRRWVGRLEPLRTSPHEGVRAAVEWALRRLAAG